LAANRVSELLAFAHSGITAEGDNGVLMQKVAKELFTSIAKGEYATLKPQLHPKDYDFTQT